MEKLGSNNYGDGSEEAAMHEQVDVPTRGPMRIIESDPNID